MNTQIIAIANQKGGVGKTTTCANLGIGLAQAGKKVLLIDGNPQGSLTISLGNPQPDKLPFTLSDAMGKILMDQPIRPGEGILHHAEGVDLMPADIQLSGMEVSLVNAMSRETILRQYLDILKGQYSHILIDCQPSLGMLTVNALAAANRIIIPVQAEYLPAKGLEQLLSTVSKVKRQINPKLQIDGILLTMVDNRTNFAKEIAALLRDTYGSKIKIFGTEIPHSVRAKEISAEGKSIFAHDPGGKVAEGYRTSGCAKQAIVLYEYQPTRKAEHAEHFLQGFSGWLHADGYQGYHRLPGNIRVVGCWAHARRKFNEALSTLSQEKRKDAPAAMGEWYCSQLFKLEQALAELTPEERHKKRLEQEKPVLDELLSWANEIQAKAAPKSALEKAIYYLLEQWSYLTRYLEDGRLELSNNRAERSIKPFVMGRKNWLFANTTGGAQASAVIYSLIETAKVNGLDPYRYLLWVLQNAPQLSQTDEAWPESLLPANVPEECYMTHK